MSIDTQPVARRRHTLFCELTQREERGNWFRIEDLPTVSYWLSPVLY